MGLVLEHLRDRVRAYPEKTVTLKNAVVTPGQDEVSVDVEAISEEEVKRLVTKLDVLANVRQNESIAAMVVNSWDAILTAVRWVKAKTAQEFKGIKAVGKQLDVVWLRPEDVGGSILNSASASNKGLYGGTSGGVYTWLNSFTAGTSDDMIPEQKMKEEAACVHMGLIDTITAPSPVNRIKFKVSGQTTPAQSLALNHTDGSALPFQEFELPIVVGPKQTQRVDIDPYITKDGRPELLTLLIAMAEDLTF